MIDMMNANHAAAIAAKLARVDVTAVYPISPFWTISASFSEMDVCGVMG